LEELGLKTSMFWGENEGKCKAPEQGAPGALEERQEEQ
jgi:hypothetical protein